MIGHRCICRLTTGRVILCIAGVYFNFLLFNKWITTSSPLQHSVTFTTDKHFRYQHLLLQWPRWERDFKSRRQQSNIREEGSFLQLTPKIIPAWLHRTDGTCTVCPALCACLRFPFRHARWQHGFRTVSKVFLHYVVWIDNKFWLRLALKQLFYMFIGMQLVVCWWDLFAYIKQYK